MTPHIEAEKHEIAKTILMPGDPFRAKLIADNYLENVELVNIVRGIPAYTGTYKGNRITVMASGMGMPSIGIYSYELYTQYDVENIIRIGTIGAYIEDLDLYDLILVDKCYSESTFAKTQNGCLDQFRYPSEELNQIIERTAKENDHKILTTTVHCSDVYYKQKDNYAELYQKYGCIGCEMESFALFHNAEVLNKKAACIVTVSNNLVTGEEATSEERSHSVNEMIELALESTLRI